ncbi:hypothetical protein JQK15_03990 [Sphingobium sp. BHU LFT2]|uniref:hypothetical protein n=1 Tax=Sphingobium sp. BHU LFT2 TaxID=2807634 RepID=UPI001BE50AB2|nr:hypothetical protein [Sphingobium sp. BHU LFT2]MBT2242690.1 hypothetical protein [Sphingobium sp. BHU LFT2]
MDNEGAPTLGVGLVIDFHDSFGQLRSLDDLIGSTAADAVREFQKIEAVSKNAVDLGAATAQIRTFAGATTREMASAAREMANAEKAGEALSRQLERQASTFGKTREEIRRMKVEAAAQAAQDQGLTELATRLRAQEAALYDQEFAAARKARQEVEAAAEDKALAAARAVKAAEEESIALRQATVAYQMFEAAARSGVQAMREQEAVDRAAAAARADIETRTRRFVASIDPAAAAQQRFNAEMAEARTLIGAGAISLDQYVAKLQQEKSALDTANAAIGRGTTSAGAHRQAMMGASYQVQDFFTQVSMGANPLNAFAVQGAQLAGQFANIEGKAGAVARFFMGPWGLAITAAILVGSMFTKGLFDGAAAAEAKAKAAKDLKDAIDALEKSTRAAVDTEWDQQRALLASAAAARQKALDTRAETIEQIANTRAKLAAAIAESARPDPSRGQDGGIDIATTQAALLERKMTALDKQLADQQAMLSKTEVAFRDAQAAAVGSQVSANIDATAGATRKYQRELSALNEQFRKTGDVEAYAKARHTLEKGYAAEQEAIRQTKKEQSAADRAAATETRRLEKLGRENDAVEAQIRNFALLAAAYDKSGGAAVIAEARLKAESEAIKKRADTETLVDQQVRLAIADRISAAAQNNAALRDQAKAQEEVNAQVAAGLVPAKRAADLIRERIDDLPLLASIEAAQLRGLTRETERATKALEDQRKERERLRIATINTQANSAIDASNDRLAEVREELRLIGVAEEARARALATLRAQRETESWQNVIAPEKIAAYIKTQGDIAAQTVINAQAQRNFNAELNMTAERWDLIARNVENAARGMADAFGDVGQAIGDMAAIYANFHADRSRLDADHLTRITQAGADERSIQQENSRYALATATSQIGLYGDMTSAAKGFFKEGSDGYEALAVAEKAFRAVEFALSVRAMAQDAAATASAIAKSGARTATKAVEAVVTAISSLPFPLNLAAGAATIAALAGIGVSVAGSFGGNRNTLEKANDGTGTVLGDASAKSESIKRAIDSLKEVDTVMLTYSRQMAASLSAIESNISGFAALVLRTDSVNASAGVNTGFSQDTTGKVLEGIITGGGLFSKIPVVGGIIGGIGSIIGSLFGSKTKVVGSGLYGGAQSLEDILSGGFDASYYSDIQKKKKLFGLTTSTKYSTQYSDADSGLENQFTLILREFNNAILAAAGPLGVATSEIQQKLNGFVVNIGKIDLQGLTGEEIEEKLTAVFGAAADDMAKAAFPGIEKFQAVGEGLFDTLVRVASTVESVTSSLTMLGSSASSMSIDLKMALADQFDSVSDFSSAVDSYFETYYTKEEQAAARTAQFATAFDSLGLAMPGTLAAFRQLVDAQDLTTSAGQATYATLLQLAPAFADLQSALNGAKSAADILSERQDLEKQLLELQGNTAAIREMELASLDESNRALQQQIWALQDAQEAADAAQKLKDAWSSVGDSIMDEVNRIRGITDGTGTGSFAQLQGQFNAAVAAAKAGDQDAASSLPGLSQALLQAAQLAATSRQELDRVKAQTAATLESVYASVLALAGGASATGVATGAGAPTGTILEAAATAAQASTSSSDSDSVVIELKALREEVAQLRSENATGHAATAGNTGAIKRTLDNVTAASGGEAITVVGSEAA